MVEELCKLPRVHNVEFYTAVQMTQDAKEPVSQMWRWVPPATRRVPLGEVQKGEMNSVFAKGGGAPGQSEEEMTTNISPAGPFGVGRPRPRGAPRASGGWLGPRSGPRWWSRRCVVSI